MEKINYACDYISIAHISSTETKYIKTCVCFKEDCNIKKIL